MSFSSSYIRRSPVFEYIRPFHRRPDIPVTYRSYIPSEYFLRDTLAQWVTDSITGDEKYRLKINIEGFDRDEVNFHIDGNTLFLYAERIQNRAQGTSKTIFQQAYELPTDVNTLQPFVSYPSLKTMQIDFPSLYRSSHVVKSKWNNIRSIPIHRVSINPKYLSTYSRRSNGGFVESNDDSIRNKQISRERYHPLPPPPPSSSSSSSSSTLSLSYSSSSLSSMVPRNIHLDDFYQSEFHPEIVIDEKTNQRYIEMRLDIHKSNPDDIQISINENDLSVFTNDRTFYRRITLPENADFSSLLLDYKNNGILHLTIKLLDEHSSFRYIYLMDNIITTNDEPYFSLPMDSDEYTHKLYANLIEIKDKINTDEVNMIFIAHDYKQTGRIPWNIMSKREKCIYLINICIRLCCFILSLYIFVITLDIMTSAFILLSRSVLSNMFQKQSLFRNPILGLMFGIIITTILQSSSTVTSILVSMVASGIVNDIRLVIPMIMGANIGTSVTNTLVSFTQIGNQNEFSRSFSSGVLMDLFNYLTTFCLLPIEICIDRITLDGGYLARVSGTIANLIPDKSRTNIQILKTITKPLTNLIIQINDNIISNESNQTVGKIYCKHNQIKCTYLFRSMIENNGDNTVGCILLICSLLTLTCILICMVKLLKSLIIGFIDNALRKILRIQSNGCKQYLLGYVFIIIGIVGSILVQSSSVFCSILTPLVGLEVVSLERNYELTIGANIGTTITALSASLTQTSSYFRQSIQIALTHLLFNISGCILWYILPNCRRIPILLSRRIGRIVSKYRWFAFVYIIFVFFLFPLIILLLALIHWIVASLFLVCIFILLTFILIIRYFQKTNRNKLPIVLRTWTFIPHCLRSLDYWDDHFKILFKYICWKKCINYIYPPDYVNKTLKQQYLTIKDEYFTALDHRFLTHTNQLNDLFEKYHAPIIGLCESRHRFTGYVNDFYRSITGKPTQGQKVLSLLIKTNILTKEVNIENDDETIDRIVIFNRGNRNDLFEHQNTSFSSF